jgi:hypothetical protein
MTKAPSFFLTAIGAARVIGGPPGPSMPLLLIFHGHTGSETAVEINKAVREHYPSVEKLLTASVVDLHHIPRYMRAAVELTLSAAYRQSAKQVPENLDPTEYVILVPDWDGNVTSAFGMEQRINDIGLALITTPWTTFDTYTGSDPLVAAVKMVDAATNQRSDHTVPSTTPQ